MSTRKKQAVDFTDFHGRVVLIKKDANGIITRRIGNNALSEPNKVRAAFISGNYLNDQSISPMGKTIIVGGDGLALDGSRYNIAANLNHQRCAVLLNLTGKSTTDKYIPIFDEDGSINTDVVIGWINSATSVGSNAYLGKVTNETPKQSIVAKIAGSEKRGFLDTNKGIGTITHVAEMVGLGSPVDMTPSYGGFSCWQCVSKTNTISWIVPPNITGLTGENEILVYNVEDDVSVYKINLSTGLKTETTYDASLFPVTPSDSYYLYSVYRVNSTTVIYLTNSRIYVVTYNESGVATVAQTINMSTNSYPLYGVYQLVADAESYVYVEAASYSGSTYYNYIYKISLNDFTYTTINAVQNPVIGGIPATWIQAKTTVLAYNNSKYYVGQCGSKEVLVCTDITDVCGTLVGTMYYPGDGFSVLASTAIPDLMFMTLPSRVQDQFIDFYSKTDITNPDTQSSSQNIYTNKKLAWLCAANYSNWYNLYQLSSPMEKTSADTVDFSHVLTYKASV